MLPKQTRAQRRLSQPLANPRMRMYCVRFMQLEGAMTYHIRGVNRSPTHLLHQAEQAAGKLFLRERVGLHHPASAKDLDRGL
jgi:hypothetical protein